MKDYRLKENREEYFTKMYKANLEHRVMPGCVYLVLPELAKKGLWSNEDKLWAAAVNGNTQNPITTLRILKRFPELPKNSVECSEVEQWFNENWDTLAFDVDRRYAKKLFPEFVKSYARMSYEAGSQEKILTGTFSELWERVNKNFVGFGRLSSFSYLEYVHLLGFGADCDRMFFEDKSGSKSHRNGMLFLIGRDDMVWDKRQENSHNGNYDNFRAMCSWLESRASGYLHDLYPTFNHKDMGFFTLESNLCSFKNSFFSRRYMGVYSDMFLDRIKWYDDRGFSDLTKVFKQIREDKLPEWLREECEGKVVDRKVKAAQFADTGVPFRAEHFM